MQAVASKVGLEDAADYFYLFETVEYNFGEPFCLLFSTTVLSFGVSK